MKSSNKKPAGGIETNTPKAELSKGEFNLKLEFGAMSPHIAVQLKKQQFKFHGPTIAELEGDRVAMVRLRLHGYITDSGIKQFHRKLFRVISKHVQQQNDFKPKGKMKITQGVKKEGKNNAIRR